MLNSRLFAILCCCVVFLAFSQPAAAQAKLVNEHGTLCNNLVQYSLWMEVHDIATTVVSGSAEFASVITLFPPSVAPPQTTVDVYVLAAFHDGEPLRISRSLQTFNSNFVISSPFGGGRAFLPPFDFLPYMPANQFCEVEAYAKISISDPAGICGGNTQVVRKIENGFEC